MQKIDLDEPLIEFVTSYGTTPWTIRHAFEGVQVFGGIGSGKTSGSGRLIATKYLLAGWGGLVLTCKNDERDSWVEYAKETGRADDLFILEINGHHKFNFLSYLSGQSNGRELTENIVDVLKTVIQASQDKGGNLVNDAFWSNALDQVLNFAIELTKMAHGEVTVEQLYSIIQSLPQQSQPIAPVEGREPSEFYLAFTKAKNKIKTMIEEWENSIGKEEVERLNRTGKLDEAIYNISPLIRQFKQIDEFFMSTYRTLADKTRSIVDFTISGFFFRLLKEPVFSLFCEGVSTIKPELSTRGKIILINLPTKEFSKVGRDAQVLFKYIWQKAMEARKINENTKPVFLFVDESQEMLHPNDANFQATARSSRIATVYLTQNINNYMSVMGGEKADYKVKALLGLFGTKIFHANSDSETNNYSSDLLGQSYKEITSESSTIANDTFSKTTNKSVELEKTMRPEEFAALNTGGERNAYKVQAILYRQGDKMLNGLNYLKVSFNQKIK